MRALVYCGQPAYQDQIYKSLCTCIHETKLDTKQG